LDTVTSETDIHRIYLSYENTTKREKGRKEENKKSEDSVHEQRTERVSITTVIDTGGGKSGGFAKEGDGGGDGRAGGAGAGWLGG